jgi:sortase A
MSRRGSAQLLLLFFRPRSRLGWTLGAIAGVLVVAGLLQAGGDFPLLTRTGLAQVLRQSAWQHALAGLPEPAPWPWAATPPATTAKVPRLGLSASVVKEGSPSKDEGAAIEPPQPASGEDPRAPRTKLSEVGVGDRITVTTADGSSRVYRVTGRRVVDPHLAETDSGPSDADTTLVTCLPLDPLLASTLRLVIQATKDDLPAPSEPRPEQKL